MQIDLYADEQRWPIEFDPALLSEARDYFSKLDTDMAQGWQLGRHWIAQPTLEERCQIVAERLRIAVERQQRAPMAMLAAYLASRIPNLREVHIGEEGSETHFVAAGG